MAGGFFCHRRPAAYAWRHDIEQGGKHGDSDGRPIRSPARSRPYRERHHRCGQEVWREPVANYRSEQRLAAEIEQILRRSPTPFCPSAALPEAGSYVAREAAGVPIVVVRGTDGEVRAFRNACRHRGMQVASGSGCARAFVCRYHGWTYNLEGRLRHIPHEEGFPGFDKDAHPLVPVAASERLGLCSSPRKSRRPGAIRSRG